MTRPAHANGGSPAYYAEDRAAVNGPLVFNGVFWLPLFAATSLGIAATGSILLLIPSLVALCGFMLTLGTFGLVWCWPIDIRIDDEGIRIGGLRRAARRARKGQPKFPPMPNRQRGEVFSCPWDAVLRVEVVTDRSELKKLRKAAPDIGLKRLDTVALGRLWSLHMHAALVVNLDPDHAVYPRFMEKNEQIRKKLGVFTCKLDSFHSPVWIAPTRHPDQLRAALERHGVPVS
jgi:hypothetical protein